MVSLITWFGVAWAQPAPLPPPPEPERIEALRAHRIDAACGHCHDDPHLGVAPDCAECHVSDAWVPSLFTAQDHASTAFPLAGLHLEAPCRSCHVEAVLRPLPIDCAGCHVDRHRGKLGADCTECHTVAGWSPVPDFDHLARTGFALAPPHGEATCDQCHRGANGAAMRLVTDVGCATCHAPDHGAFRGQACAGCHTPATTTFAEAALGFDHSAETAFPVERRHSALACPSCHPAAAPDPVARCASCHFDPHGGQLTAACEQCHQPDRWRLARFDHDRTGFVLRGRHFVTPCGACHTNQRWVGLTTSCADCHAYDALRGPASVRAHRFPDRCADCHRSTFTFRIGP